MNDDNENEQPDSSESLIIAHFNSVRAESMYRMKARENLMYYFFVGVGICFNYYFENTEHHSIALLAIPFLACLITSSYIQHDICVKILGMWAKVEHTKTLNEYASIKGYNLKGKRRLTFRHWDIFEGEHGPQRKLAANLRYFTNAWIPTLISLFAVIVFSSHLNFYIKNYLNISRPNMIDIVYFVIIVVLVLLSYFPVIFMHIAKYYRKIKN